MTGQITGMPKAHFYYVVHYYVESSPCAAGAYSIYDNRGLGTSLGCSGLTLSEICPISRPD